jgi:hypothetical protein
MISRVVRDQTSPERRRVVRASGTRILSGLSKRPRRLRPLGDPGRQRDDGVGTIKYIEQLTYLLFLKMAHERETCPLKPR